MPVFENVDAAAREYRRVTGGDPEALNRVPGVGAEPTLNDCYEPSALQKDCELMFMAGGLALAGWAAFKFL